MATTTQTLSKDAPPPSGPPTTVVSEAIRVQLPNRVELKSYTLREVIDALLPRPDGSEKAAGSDALPALEVDPPSATAGTVVLPTGTAAGNGVFATRPFAAGELVMVDANPLASISFNNTADVALAESLGCVGATFGLPLMWRALEAKLDVKAARQRGLNIMVPFPPPGRKIDAPPVVALTKQMDRLAQRWGKAYEEVLELFRLIECNLFLVTAPLSGAPLGAAVFGAGSGVNHSCRPNCLRVLTPTRMALYAARRIGTNEPITISYADKAVGYQRAPDRRLDFLHGSPCECPACIGRTAQRHEASASFAVLSALSTPPTTDEVSWAHAFVLVQKAVDEAESAEAVNIIAAARRPAGEIERRIWSYLALCQVPQVAAPAPEVAILAIETMAMAVLRFGCEQTAVACRLSLVEFKSTLGAHVQWAIARLDKHDGAEHARLRLVVARRLLVSAQDQAPLAAHEAAIVAEMLRAEPRDCLPAGTIP